MPASPASHGFRAVGPGDRLGRYELLELVGEGGMAAVFRAKDPELRREVAVKVLFPHLSRRQEVVARFQREARAAARLLHPAILQIFDVGGGERTEPPYLVMELVRGAALQEHLAKHGPMLSEIVAAVGLRIAEALAEAHDAGVIHRDLKPANLLISDDGRLLLADFGVARVDRDDSLATRTGAVLGTPAYMSPEQAVGEHVDARSDLYSLGATLYHLATGVVPYSGSTMKILGQLAVGALVPPDQRRPAVGRELSTILLRLMAHEPSARPSDARAAAALLRPLAAVLGDPSTELATYWRDPTSYTRDKLPTVVDRLVRDAKVQHERGKWAAAMAAADRAHALAPEDDGVATIVDEVTRRKPSGRGLWAGAALATTLLATSGLFWATRDDSPSGSGPASPSPGNSPSGSSSSSSSGAPSRASSSSEAPPPSGSASPSGASASSGSTSSSRSSAGPESPSGAPSPSPRIRPPRHTQPTPAATASAPPPELPTTAPPEPAPAPVAEIGHVTFLMDAWCELRIDGAPHGRADRSRAIALSAGRHLVECSQGVGLGQWRGEVVVVAGAAHRVTGQVRVQVDVRVDVSGSTVLVDGVPVANGAATTLPNGRHRVSVRQGDRELSTGWVSIPRVARCILRDRPLLDCYPES